MIRPAVVPVSLVLLLMLGLMISPPAARAQIAVQAVQEPDDGSSDEPTGLQPEYTWDATLLPKPLPEPALKVTLLPEPHEQTPGNAALQYAEMAVGVGSVEIDEQEFHTLSEMPLDELSEREVPPWLRNHREVLDLLRTAARRERIHWDRPVREQGYAMVLPSLNQYRKVARLLSLQIRFDMAHGEVDRAVERLKDGFAMAKQIAAGPTLVETLVGVAIAGLMRQRVQELMSLPEAPNLYWALTSLPDPLIDLKNAIRHELAMLDLWVPELKKARAGELATDEARELMRRILRVSFSGPGGSMGLQPRDAERWSLVIALRDYSRAKRMLRKRGYTEEEIKAMPVPTAVLMYQLHHYDRLRDGILKWFGVPYWQARQGMAEAEETIDQATAQGLTQPFGILMPSMSRAAEVHTMLGQRIAALRTVAAVRHYAAIHGGQLPTSLEAIGELPIPIDPYTGKPFVYQLNGRTFTLTSGVELVEREDPPLRIRITVLRPGADDQPNE